MHTYTEMTLKFLQDLIRIDTTNPPGNELGAATYVADVLRSHGIEAMVLESAPQRGNVVARLRGDGSARPLLLMSHLDVVPADPQGWDHPPFAAHVADGYIWGRGSTDTKQLTAMQMTTMIALTQEQIPLARDVILVASADEEVGGAMGMKWLVDQHWELIEAQYAINEGGGFGLRFGGGNFYLCQTGEKGICWMRFTTTGKAGHGAMPGEDNAVIKLATALQQLSRVQLPQHRTRTVVKLVRALAAALPFPRLSVLPLALNGILERVVLSSIGGESEIATLLRSTLRNTVAATVLSAGSKTNVIPAEATAHVDGRLMPDQSPDDLLREIRPYIGPDVQIDFLETSAGYESDPESALFECFQQVLVQHDPGSKLLPYIVPGGTDGRFLAERGVKVYGFSPSRYEPGWNALAQAHAQNERLSLANLEFGTDVLRDVVCTFCRAASSIR